MPSSAWKKDVCRSEEHTSELQSLTNLVCRLLLEKNTLQGASPDASQPQSDRQDLGARSLCVGPREDSRGCACGVGDRPRFFFYGRGAPRVLHFFPIPAFSD